MLATHAPPLAIQSRPEIAAAAKTQQRLSPTVLLFPDGGTSSTAYAAALDACNRREFGQQVHAHLLKSGFRGREFLQTKLLQMYGECGSMDDMAQVFDEMPDRNSYTYTAILNVLLHRGLFQAAFEYYERLLIEGITPEFFIFPVAFKICPAHGGAELGRQLHGTSVKTGVVQHMYVGNALIDMYGKCGNLDNAMTVFRSMSERDHLSGDLVIAACARNGKMLEGLRFLGQLGVEPNVRMLGDVLCDCGRLGNVRLGKEIYGYVLRRGVMSTTYVVNGLIELYKRCGDVERGHDVFSKHSGRDVVSYNTMIAGYCNIGEVPKAETLFDTMESRGVSKDLVTWNTMISGYLDNLMFDDALNLLMEVMNEGEVEPNSFTLGSALAACADMGYLALGKSIHSYCIVRGLESNQFVGSALVNMYCQCRNLEAAEKAFRRMPERDIVLWNTFISGHASCDRIERVKNALQWMKNDGFVPNIYTWNGIIARFMENGQYEMALHVFFDLQGSNLRPDVYTVRLVLTVCSRLVSLERGKQVHGHAIRCRYHEDDYVTAGLIDTYAKCGMILYAKRIHETAENHNRFTKNIMLNAYAINGFGNDGIAYFRGMLADGFEPDAMTFLAVLSLCVCTGSVDTGWELFDMMGNCGVIPSLKHYTCMVDLLSRAGQVKQAYEMIQEIPMDPDSMIWGALLGGCIIHMYFDLGEIAAREIIKLEPDNSGNYVMLANLYASMEKWYELGKLRRMMKIGELYKKPGCSWIEDQDRTHVFMACDRSHERAQEVYDVLDSLTAQMRLVQMQLVQGSDT